MLKALTAGLTSCWQEEGKKEGESRLTEKRRVAAECLSHYQLGWKRAFCQGHGDRLVFGQGVWRRRTDLGEQGSVFCELL